MRQWPAEHFAALVDLLVEADGVNVLLIGGPDEVELAQEVLDKVARRDAVASVAGKTSLAELSLLLACCALYVGNNSGPKHIAAAIGVPTIGVHSGVVDPAEWAPIGKRAMALRRNMTCGPCYLSRLEDCPRTLACLRQLEPASVWQVCRTLLATSRVPLYDTAAPSPPPRERAAEDAAVTGTKAATDRRRGGRRRGAGKTAAAGPEPIAVVEAPAPTEALVEAPAEDASAAASGPTVEAPIVQAPGADAERDAAEAAPLTPEPPVAGEAAASPEAPSEPPAEDAAVTGTPAATDRRRGGRKRGAGRTEAAGPEPIAVVEAPAPTEALVEAPAEDASAAASAPIAEALIVEVPGAEVPIVQAPGADAQREAAEAARLTPQPPVAGEAAAPPETPSEPPPADDAAAAASASIAAASRAGRRRAGGKTTLPGPEPAAVVEVSASPATAPEAPGEPPAEDAATAPIAPAPIAEVPIADAAHAEPEHDAAETVPPIPEPAISVEAAAPEAPPETPLETPSEPPSADAAVITPGAPAGATEVQPAPEPQMSVELGGARRAADRPTGGGLHRDRRFVAG